MQQGPFGASRAAPGVAGSFRPNAEATIWTARLRRGVSFSNGEPLDADAVLVNADRWIGSAAGAELLPDLAAVDSPRPGRVRFLLDRPSKRLSDARSPTPASAWSRPAPLLGSDRSGLRLDASGTGPFEYRERDGGPRPARPQRRLVGNAARARARRRPGRADAVARRRRSGSARSSGEDAEIADELGRTAATRLAADPLLTVVTSGGVTLGLERSVRGFDSATRRPVARRRLAHRPALTPRAAETIARPFPTLFDQITRHTSADVANLPRRCPPTQSKRSRCTPTT